MQSVGVRKNRNGDTIHTWLPVESVIHGRIAFSIAKESFDRNGIFLWEDSEWQGESTVQEYLSAAARAKVEPDWNAVQTAWEYCLEQGLNPMTAKATK